MESLAEQIATNPAFRAAVRPKHLCVGDVFRLPSTNSHDSDGFRTYTVISSTDDAIRVEDAHGYQNNIKRKSQEMTRVLKNAVRPANFRAALDARPDVVDRVLEDVSEAPNKYAPDNDIIYVSPDTLDQAARDWRDGKLYLQGNNWRLKGDESGGKNRVAPYNGELKKRGVTWQQLTDDAQQRIAAKETVPSDVSEADISFEEPERWDGLS